MPRRKRMSSEMEDSDLDSDESCKNHPQRNAANARERARMRVLSRAFHRLKTTLPWVPVDTKLSKLDTLRLATSYIAHLRAVLMDQNLASSEIGHHKHPLTLTWPFSFTKSEVVHSADGNGGGLDIFPSSWADMVPSIQSSNATAATTPVIRDKDVSYYY